MGGDERRKQVGGHWEGVGRREKRWSFEISMEKERIYSSAFLSMLTLTEGHTRRYYSVRITADSQAGKQIGARFYRSNVVPPYRLRSSTMLNQQC